MKVLAVDTSCVTASCAVVEGDKILGELNTQHAKTHSQKLIPMIDSLFHMLDMKMESIDLFAAAIGPGSFTGLRIGVVTIKGMAYASKKPVCGIPTLDALAYSVEHFKGIICPMLDARNNQVYTCLYQKDEGNLTRMTDYMGIAIDEMPQLLFPYEQEILVLGDATYLHSQYLATRLRTKLHTADHSLSTPRAACAALLAQRQAMQGALQSAFDLEPLYLRKSQAERMKELC